MTKTSILTEITAACLYVMQPSLCLLRADWMMLHNAQLQIPCVEGRWGHIHASNSSTD